MQKTSGSASNCHEKEKEGIVRERSPSRPPEAFGPVDGTESPKICWKHALLSWDQFGTLFIFGS